MDFESSDAVLIPPSEIKLDRLGNTDRPVVEQESQEELFDELFSIYFARLHEGLSMYAAVKEMETRYTLTRKP